MKNIQLFLVLIGLLVVSACKKDKASGANVGSKGSCNSIPKNGSYYPKTGQHITWYPENDYFVINNEVITNYHQTIYLPGKAFPVIEGTYTLKPTLPLSSNEAIIYTGTFPEFYSKYDTSYSGELQITCDNGVLVAKFQGLFNGIFDDLAGKKTPYVGVPHADSIRCGK